MTLWNVKMLTVVCVSVWFLFWPCLIIYVATFGPVAMFVGGGTPCSCDALFCVTNTNNFWFSGHMGNNLLCSDQLTVLQIAAVSVRHKQDKWEDCDQRVWSAGHHWSPVDTVQIGPEFLDNLYHDQPMTVLWQDLVIKTLNMYMSGGPGGNPGCYSTSRPGPGWHQTKSCLHHHQGKVEDCEHKQQSSRHCSCHRSITISSIIPLQPKVTGARTQSEWHLLWTINYHISLLFLSKKLMSFNFQLM